jgi:hypothetical protein
MYVLSGAARGRDAQLPTFDPLALQQKIISALPPSERHSYSSIRFIETMADVLANEGLFDMVIPLSRFLVQSLFLHSQFIITFCHPFYFIYFCF